MLLERSLKQQQRIFMVLNLYVIKMCVESASFGLRNVTAAPKICSGVRNSTLAAKCKPYALLGQGKSAKSADLRRDQMRRIRFSIYVIQEEEIHRACPGLAMKSMHSTPGNAVQYGLTQGLG
jgi:hypothetical protein